MAKYIASINRPETQMEILTTKISEIINLINELSTDVEQIYSKQRDTELKLSLITEQLNVISNNAGIKALISCSNESKDSQ